jgi:hypothetical protein
MTSLGAWPNLMLELACDRCQRRGRYRRDRLIARWGADAPLDLVKTQIVEPCTAGPECQAHYVVPREGRWLTAGQLARALQRHHGHLPALIGGTQLLPVREIRIIGVDMAQPVRMKHYGAPAILIAGGE